MSWDVPKIWDGGTCWIIGGGHSIPSQFNIPKKVCKKVYSGELPISSFSPYMEMLHDKHVIGINNSYRLGEWVDFCFFGDKQWYFDNFVDIKQYKGIVVGCAEFIQLPGWEHLNIKFLRKSIQAYGISNDKQEVRFNYNSGLAAISLAAHLGCKRVILLGFDMCLSPEGTGHFHNLYNNKTNMPFNKHLQAIDTVAEDAVRMGIEIINASPISVISAFPKMNVKDIPL